MKMESDVLEHIRETKQLDNPWLIHLSEEDRILFLDQLIVCFECYFGSGTIQEVIVHYEEKAEHE